jgi:hypothetical protein
MSRRGTRGGWERKICSNACHRQPQHLRAMGAAKAGIQPAETVGGITTRKEKEQKRGKRLPLAYPSGRGRRRQQPDLSWSAGLAGAEPLQ